MFIIAAKAAPLQQVYGSSKYFSDKENNHACYIFSEHLCFIFRGYMGHSIEK